MSPRELQAVVVCQGMDCCAWRVYPPRLHGNGESKAACPPGIKFVIPSVAISLAEADIQILHHENDHRL